MPLFALRALVACKKGETYLSRDLTSSISTRIYDLQGQFYTLSPVITAVERHGVTKYPD
jgi:hypothetical protein